MTTKTFWPIPLQQTPTCAMRHPPFWVYTPTSPPQADQEVRKLLLTRHDPRMNTIKKGFKPSSSLPYTHDWNFVLSDSESSAKAANYSSYACKARSHVLLLKTCGGCGMNLALSPEIRRGPSGEACPSTFFFFFWVIYSSSTLPFRQEYSLQSLWYSLCKTTAQSQRGYEYTVSSLRLWT